jgi:hypothetical protein
VGPAYRVLLYAGEPYLGRSGKDIYNWVFVIGIIVACAWVVVTWVQKCVPQVSGTESRRLRKVA